jgi:cell division protease FtsH
MSEELGPLSYGKKEEQIFLGREISQHRDYSEDTARQIDAAVKDIVLNANDSVTRLLQDNIDILKAVADELLEKETIMLEDIDRIMLDLKEGKDPKESRVKPEQPEVTAAAEKPEQQPEQSEQAEEPEQEQPAEQQQESSTAEV